MLRSLHLRGISPEATKIGLAAFVSSTAFAGTASASDPITTPAPASQEGCVSPAGDTCTYTTTRTGGYVANGGAWSLVVAIPTTVGDPRDVNADGNLTYTFGPGNAPPQGCSLFGPGATITTSAGASSGIVAGNPFLAATDSGVSNPCAGGSLPDRTDSTPQ
ncbi:MAG TPA: hypothetical protein VFD31_01260 [Thermoleophilaceae bacterium]|nr:hypothetical protein [Thermoleophilaceae bacterium]